MRRRRESQVQMMQIGAQMAGLDQCDLRVAYGNFLTSTPTKYKVCFQNNMECWEMGEFNASVIPTYGHTSDSDPDKTPDTDNSYGGHWGNHPDSQELVENMSGDDLNTNVVTGEEDFTAPGRYHVDSLALGMEGVEEIPHVDSLQLPPLGEHLRAHLTQENQVQFVFTGLKSREGEDVTNVTNILDKSFCHKIDKDHPSQKESINDPKLNFRTVNLRIMSSNLRGWYGKKEALETISASESLDVIALCETFTTGKRHPVQQGFVTYYRNRLQRANGGVALMIREDKAKYAVKVSEGRGDNEFFGVKFTNCDPNIVIFVYYGQHIQH